MQRTCLECDEKLAGRVDKKFCGDYCRNAYHNKLNQDRRKIMRNVNNRLRKNYRILEECNPKEKTTISKKRLINQGFNFNYFTSIYTTKSGKVYYFVYDQGYLPLDNGIYALVKRN